MAYKNKDDERARIARRKHYENNREQYYRNNEIKKDRMRVYLKSIKDVPCNDCNIKYPSYVMDFDHRDQKQKLGSINSRIMRGSWKKLQEEIKKCDVVCANCHRVRTAKQLGYK